MLAGAFTPRALSTPHEVPVPTRAEDRQPQAWGAHIRREAICRGRKPTSPDGRVVPGKADSPPIPVSSARLSGWLVFTAAVVANLTGLLNGFANDDTPIIPLNSVVTQAHWGRALLGPYWPLGRAGLYRPVTLGSFALEWRLWGGSPLGYHVVNVLVHAVVALLVLVLLRRLVPARPALVGALWFAMQPVHVEAVANVVGRSELYAAAFFLSACLLYLDGAAWRGAARAGRLAGLCALYLLGIGSKEIAATLPVVLILLEVVRPSDERLRDRLGREASVYFSLVVMLAGYLLLRWAVLGSLLREVPASWFRGTGAEVRILTALSVWAQYLRLMVLPLRLSSDYAPGVVPIAVGVTPAVVAGGVVFVGWVAAIVGCRRRAPAISAGLAWFLVTVLPVSNLLFPSGIIMAERVLYLPSVGMALVVGGVVVILLERLPEGRTRRLLGVAGVVLAAVFLWRSETRSPTWKSTATVVKTLMREHPESYVSLRIHAGEFARAGDTARAARDYEAAVRLAPAFYSLLVEAGGFYLRIRHEDHGARLLREAMTLRPDQAAAYTLLAEQRLRLGDGRAAHHIALEGLARAGSDRDLYAILSESYIAKGDLEAAVRARRAALAQDPGSRRDWRRLADLLDALGRKDEAAGARTRAEGAR